MNYAIAIDIGGTNTRVALIDENYEIEERRQFATDAQDPFATIEEIRKTIQSFGKSAKGIGISCPGPLDLLHGYILTTTNLGEKWWNYPICEKLSDRTAGLSRKRRQSRLSGRSGHRPGKELSLCAVHDRIHRRRFRSGHQ